VNLRLVRDGLAAPYFFSGDEGRYAKTIFKAAVAARTAGKGLWSHCRKGAVEREGAFARHIPGGGARTSTDGTRSG
jgi:endonuclease YncB( thermonuclease family)